MHDSSHTKAEANELQTATGNGRIAKRTGKSKCLEIAEILNSAIVAFLCTLIKFYKKIELQKYSVIVAVSNKILWRSI